MFLRHERDSRHSRNHKWRGFIINNPFLRFPAVWWCSPAELLHLQSPWGRNVTQEASWRWNLQTWCFSKLSVIQETSRGLIAVKGRRVLLSVMCKNQRTDLVGHEERRPSHQNMWPGRTGAGTLMGRSCRDNGKSWVTWLKWWLIRRETLPTHL